MESRHIAGSIAAAETTRMLGGLLLRRLPPEHGAAQLEHALLRLCVALDASPAAVLVELSELDDKRWKRLALLLFASDAALVRALTALLMRVAQRPEAAAEALRLRLWRSPWRGHLRDKLLDCRTEPQAKLATRLLCILSASLRSVCCSSVTEEELAALEAVELLLTLSVATERSLLVAQAAAQELLQLLQLHGETRSELLELLHSHMCRSAVWRQYSAWLLDEKASVTAIQCSQTYLELLATVAVPQTTKTVCRPAYGGLLDDTPVMLQIYSRGLHSTSVDVQLAALQLLRALLGRGDAGAALCSAVRLSGGLLSLSWLLAHVHSKVASAAASTLELVIQRSPISDVLRAVLEQGCLVIWSALQTTPGTGDHCKRLLFWATREVTRQTNAVAACVQSVLSSSNARLQRNLVLTLQLLAQRSGAVRQALEQLQFCSDALPLALQADEHGELAAALLATALACCDRCSTLKIDAQTAASSSSGVENQALHKAPELQEATQNLIVLCADEERVEVSALVLGRLATSVQDDAASDDRTVALETFKAPVVRLLALLTPQSASQAAQTLAGMPQLEPLLELLHLAQVTGSTKCWHAATTAVCRRLTRANWLQVFRFACDRVRHPTLILRSVRFGLELHRDSSNSKCKRQPQGESDEVETETLEAEELAAALRLAAVQLGQELFAG